MLILLWIVSGGWFWNKPKEIKATEILMDTTVAVKIYTRDVKKGKHIIEKAFEEARRIERIMEANKGNGELRRLNTRKRFGRFGISPELRDVIKAARSHYEMSGGAFDPTIAPVKWLWNFEDDGRVPSESEMQDAIRLVGFSRIELRGDSLQFDDLQTKLDLGGVAKGYVVDRMIDRLRQGGIQSIIINAGGDIATFGTKPGGEAWVIGLRHPRLPRTLVLSWNPYPAVATSGDYQRYFMENGRRYHHILDPKTGYPAEDCVSVTVWTTNAMVADILATTIFVLGPEKGIELAEKLENVETCIFYEKDGRVDKVLSSGVKGRIGI